MANEVGCASSWRPLEFVDQLGQLTVGQLGAILEAHGQ